MKKIISLLLVTVFFFNCIPLQPKANEVINFEEMGEYDGYLEAFYESYVTNSAYVAARYTENLGYVEGIISQLKQNVKAVVDELKSTSCNDEPNCNSAIELYKKIIAGTATIFDFVKNFFDDEEENFYQYDDSWYANYFGFQSALNIKTVSGYEFVVKDYNGVIYYNTEVSGASSYANALMRVGGEYIGVKPDVLFDETWGVVGQSWSHTAFMIASSKLGVTIGIRSTGSDVEEKPPIDTNYGTINNYIQNNNNLVHPDYKPQIGAQLVCPSATTNLDIVGGALMLNDYTLDVNKQTGQTVFNGENCLVNFIPTMPEITDDGRIVAINSDGTRVDLETNLPINVDDMDYSLIEYVSNAYNYATTVIQNGVNGLRSIISGTSGLITFTGSMFAFLPPEILSLFIGGFSIALGLWVFKK